MKGPNLGKVAYKNKRYHFLTFRFTGSLPKSRLPFAEVPLFRLFYLDMPGTHRGWGPTFSRPCSAIYYAMLNRYLGRD